MEKEFKEYLDKVNRIYKKRNRIVDVEKKLNISYSKALKLLVTSKAYVNEETKLAEKLYKQGLKTDEIAKIMNKSKRNVNEILPYHTFPKEVSFKTNNAKYIEKRKMRLDAINKGDIFSILKEFEGFKNIKYKVIDDGVLIGEKKYSYKSDEVKQLIDKIVNTFKH